MKTIDQFSDEYQDCVTEILESNEYCFDVYDIMTSMNDWAKILNGSYQYRSIEEVIYDFQQVEPNMNKSTIKSIIKYLATNTISKTFQNFLNSLGVEDISDIEENLENMLNEVYLEARNHEIITYMLKN